MSLPRCATPEQAGFDTRRAAEEAWDALLGAGVFVEGEFQFASGIHATLKADAERLHDNPRQLATMLGLFATHPCIQDADTLLYVPDGMRRFTTLLGNETGKPVVGASRRPGATSKYDFVFDTPDDEALAWASDRPVITEDVVTTLGSVAGIRRLLRPEQDVHSLAMLLRGTVDPEYQADLTDHYLLVREIPTDKDAFRRMLSEKRF